MAGWHHRLDGHGFGWTLGVDGQGGLVCCGSWGRKESDTTKRLNNNKVHITTKFTHEILFRPLTYFINTKYIETVVFENM